MVRLSSRCPYRVACCLNWLSINITQMMDKLLPFTLRQPFWKQHGRLGSSKTTACVSPVDRVDISIVKLLAENKKK